MIIENLTLRDFRVFDGEHQFDLQPRVKYNKKRPIILFGGLNGAGKTTILSAIRLALYGRMSLGSNVSKREYDEFLKRSIHRTRGDEGGRDSAVVELTFSYASMGIIQQYIIKRSWRLTSSGIKEDLSITQDGELLPNMTAEHCQGFLNELVPIGVSDLFFFDGEKIADLAEDATGEALGEAIKKLLGLDLIETLDADLGIFLRGLSKQAAPKEVKARMQQLEAKLCELENAAGEALSHYEQLKPQEIELKATLERLELQLSSKGGAWAATRDDEIRKEAELSEEKRQIEKEVREVLDGSYPLSLATKLMKRTCQQLEREAKQMELVAASKLATERLTALDKRLCKILEDEQLSRVRKTINEEFDELLSLADNQELIHGVSGRALATVLETMRNAKGAARKKAVALAKQMQATQDKIDVAGKNIARAPSEEQLQPIVDLIGKTHELLGSCKLKQRQHIEDHKHKLREALVVARKLEQESSLLTAGKEKDRTTAYANGTRGLLKDFAAEIAKSKVQDLENEFIQSFHRLTRKDDIDYVASIDPENFSVKLLRADRTEVDKNELSAGEKQIYAIAILEALARTSGRNLPIIIDTPLGRLDSIHRSNLVNHYFPAASHQVIILSTDTEVDESFYADLSKSISHAFELRYSPQYGHTCAEEGYFWKQRNLDLQGAV
ncbi:DNA sulfur modification protein DndD [Candidatus Thiodiazotropha endoloripes]|uniref:DNA sulfur modification protein DndD n=1 Tax=Candidatus Thiodiazotropha endoloripes TaxID=1818881 RepID=UPI00083DB6E5|nr:DNA sulfur modification protein DndD [Candidatus Thiodiazotropha endoloripes]ODB88003.1 DNA sulfur modification protein DndD [Candidatus Thiodiazotropha endoloripes]